MEQTIFDLSPNVIVKNNCYFVDGEWNKYMYFKKNNKWFGRTIEKSNSKATALSETAPMAIFLERFIRKQKLSKLLS